MSQKILDLLEVSTYFQPCGDELMLILGCQYEDQCFTVQGEETGDVYLIYFNEVDLSKDQFFKLANAEV